MFFLSDSHYFPEEISVRAIQSRCWIISRLFLWVYSVSLSVYYVIYWCPCELGWNHLQLDFCHLKMAAVRLILLYDFMRWQNYVVSCNEIYNMIAESINKPGQKYGRTYYSDVNMEESDSYKEKAINQLYLNHDGSSFWSDDTAESQGHRSTTQSTTPVHHLCHICATCAPPALHFLTYLHALT